VDQNKLRFQRALDLVAKIESAPNVATLNLWFAEVASEFGVESFGATILGRHGEPLKPRIVASHSDPAWARRYFERNYFSIDPTLSELRLRSTPFSWEEMEAKYRQRSSQALFSDARDAGFREGLDVPWHTADGLMGVVTLRGDRLDLSPEAKPVLRLVATYYAEVARELSEIGDDSPGEERLSVRQLECLVWAAEGKSDWEISQILNIAEGTVHRHFERIRERLNVATRIQAIVIALRNGWIVPSSGLVRTTRDTPGKD
jgi:LuxR family transcriptional regulator, quorum-sensing system regulator BjaR1